MADQYDRITQILQSQATPQTEPLSYVDSANSLLSALNGGDYSTIYRGRQQENYQNQRQVQSDQVSREMGILDIFERQKAAGDANARALDEKIKLFTGDDPEGMAIFLEALHNDPEDIDPGNSYQVMTKLAGIAKQTGYQSPAMKKKATMDAVNTEIMNRLKTNGEKTSLNVRNNNPGNMRPIGQNEGFQAFSSPQEGLQAMESDLLAKIGGKSKIMTERYGKGYTPTLQAIIETWAPPNENDTTGYVNFVSQKTGIQPNQVLSQMDIKRLIPAMIEMEGGQEAAQYYNTAPTGTETAQTDTQMNDGVDDITQLQVMAALANGDQEGALKIMADAQEKANKVSEPSSPQGKLESDYRKGLITKETYDKVSKNETVELDKLNEGKKTFDSVISDISTLLDELDKEGGIVNTDKNPITNAGRYMANTEGGSTLWGLIPVPGGQDVGRAFGTKEQTIRDKIDAKKKLLSRVIMQATGMSAKQMDSNTELKMFMNSLGNPSSSYQANKDILKTLSQTYGLGVINDDKAPAQNFDGFTIERVD